MNKIEYTPSKSCIWHSLEGHLFALTFDNVSFEVRRSCFDGFHQIDNEFNFIRAIGQIVEEMNRE